MGSPNEFIQSVPLDDTLLGSYEAQYGVKFEAATQQHLDDFTRFQDALTEARAGLSSTTDSLGIPMEPTIYYQPAAFLSAPLTPQQRSAINTDETKAIAEYCLSIQTQLEKVPIVENMDPMRNIPHLFRALGVDVSFSDIPFHEACGAWAGQQRQYWIREKFAQRMYVFGTILNAVGLGLHIEDAFRPVDVQEGLFKRRMQWTKRDYPEWSEAELLAETRSKTATTPRLASHKAGAAVDARLRSLVTGDLLDFGHEYPAGGAIVYPKSPFVTAEQWRNRQIFQVAAGLSGLTLYVGEDWHVSFGDNLASLDTHGNVRPGYVASYGPVKSFESSLDSGRILETYDENELDQTFDY